MRILFVVHGFPPYSVGGTEIYTYNLAKELNKSHEVYIFYRRADPSQEEYTVSNELFKGLQLTAINNTFRNIVDFSMTYKNEVIARKFSTFIDEIKPDIVHFQHLTCLSTSLISVCHSKGIPTVFTLHDYWMVCQRGQLLQPDLSLCSGPEDAKCAKCMATQIRSLSPAMTHNKAGATLEQHSALYNRVTAKVKQALAHFLKKRSQAQWAVMVMRRRTKHIWAMLNQIDLFIAPSRFHRNQFIRFGVPPDKILFLDNGINLRLFENFKKTPSEILRFGFIGSIIPSKGVHVLVEAFNGIDPDRAMLCIWGPDLPYDGYENYGQELRSMAANPSIHFMGDFDNINVARVLAEIDVLIVPSIWYENSPLTIHEAFAAKIPVIASNLGGMAEYVSHLKNGLLFEPRNSADLRAKINTLINNPGLIEAFSKNIGPVKTIEENARELEEVYRQLL